MATIQTQINIVHLDSGLNLGSGIQRTAEESAFTASSITVSTSDETVALGDVAAPKQMFIKLISGDGLKVGFASGTYPMRLSDAGESMIIRLDVESMSYERSTITCVADDLGSLGGTYFDMEDSSGPVRVWMNIASAVAATGSITYGSPNDGDVVYVNGTTFTKVASSPGANEFSSISELEALVEAVTGINATEDGTTISITAATAGTSGNAITLELDIANTGTMTVSGATLTGGVDASTAPATPAGGRLLPVVIVANDTANSVCSALKNALDADAQYTATNASPPTVVATDVAADLRSPITDVSTGFTVSRAWYVGGVTTVHLKSLGTSQVAIAIAPL